MTKEIIFEKNKKVLFKYLPEKSLEKICHLIFEYNFKLIIKHNRKSKWGDFKPTSSYNVPVITINATLNKYAFLITLLHEIAHCKTYKEYGDKVNAHGIEWKKNFQYLIQDFLTTDIFPIDLLYTLRKHIQNPTASANADIQLYKALLNYNETPNICLIEYLQDGDKFEYEQIIYQKITKRRKRIECIQLSTGKKYLFSPIVEVKPII